MTELPAVFDTSSWTWKPFSAPLHSSRTFWLGVDREGNQWLTKLRGSFFAYREIVFARLAQAMGWSCQSSVFLRLDKQSAEILGVSPGDIHAGHWFMHEHSKGECSCDCALQFLLGKEIRTIEDLGGCNISHITDWPKSEFAACLFGGNEPPGRLITDSHEFVIIDCELMFSTGPCSFESPHWWEESDGSPSTSGRAMAREVCSDFLSLSDQDIAKALSVPQGISIDTRWPIAPILRESQRFADKFSSSHLMIAPT